MTKAPPHTEPLHILGRFDDPFTGAELGRLALGEALAPLRPVQAWSTVPPHPLFAARGVRCIRPEAGEFPRGGMLLVTGVHVVLGPWLADAGLRRVALHYNLPDHRRLFERMAQIRAVAGLEPELVFVSPAMQASVGLPGRVELSWMELSPFLAIPVRRPTRAPTLGRHSRDVLEKHHVHDVPLYRQLVASGWRVRLMGATCLLETLGALPGLECLPSGAEPVADFLASLDVFFYRTTWAEPSARVVFEAMASGLPLVAHGSGGYASSLKHGHDAVLFQTQEQAIQALTGLQDNSALRMALGENARQRAIHLQGDAANQAVLRNYLG